MYVYCELRNMDRSRKGKAVRAFTAFYREREQVVKRESKIFATNQSYQMHQGVSY